MNSNDILTSIALRLDFFDIPSFSCCDKKTRKLIWDNPLFWTCKLKYDYDFSQKKKVISDKEAYKFMAIHSLQEVLEIAAKLGWLEFVIYHVEKYPNLNLINAMRNAQAFYRKNVVRYLKKKGVLPLSYFNLFPCDLRV